MTLTTAQLDRAAGVLLAGACGDALGVHTELGSAPLPPDGQRIGMLGGGLGGYAPGEWSDDTQMAVCIARVAATGADLTSEDALDEVAAGFEQWYAESPADVGVQTRSVLSAARRTTGRPAERLRRASQELHARTGRTAGNGALMRTAVVALPHLGNDAALVAAARGVAELTHADPLAGDACVLWVVGVDRAVRTGRLDGVRDGLDLLPEERRDRWAGWLDEAEQHPPSRFAPNGFTVPALQAAYSAVVRTPVPPLEPSSGSFPCRHLQDGLESAVRAGDDTDTVAAIAGGLLGARWGASAVPAAWRRPVHGWPGLRSRDLVRLGVLSVRRPFVDDGWPSVERMEYGGRGWVVAHPDDPDVLLGDSATRTDADAVVSLCRIGTSDAPATGVAPGDHVEVWLVDRDDPDENPNLHFVLDDAARAVAALRDEGRRVLVHCAHGRSRTPAVAARYAALRGAPVDDAYARLATATHVAEHNPALRRAVQDLSVDLGRAQRGS